MVEWTLNLGETCLQILDGRFVAIGGPSTNSDGSNNISNHSPAISGDGKMTEQLLVLTERSLFLIKVIFSFYYIFSNIKIKYRILEL